MLMATVLTDEQKRAANEKDGLFVVRACPGSGKTLTVAARLARLFSGWKHSHQGIAAISFTNVAWQEIEGYLSSEFGVKTPLRYPHFLGTIDSFLNTFIFLPFGHLVMGCQERPALTGPPHDDSEPIGTWWPWGGSECYQRGCRLNDFSYDECGELVNWAPRRRFGNCGRRHDRCQALKEQFNRCGFATQLDANYFAMRVLQQHPWVAESLALRFPVVMVDEAQDTSRIQMKILEALVDSGLRELMLVGDPDQAIYEWRTAEPGLFIRKYQQWHANSLELTDNWRSSQAICDFAARMSSSGSPMRARQAELADVNVPPEIWSYGREEELPELLSRFLANCREHGVDGNDAKVLSRSREFLGAVAGRGTRGRPPKPPWKDDFAHTRAIARSKYLLDNGQFADAFRVFQAEVCRCKLGRRFLHAGDVHDARGAQTFANWAARLYGLLVSLPDTSGCALGHWIGGAQRVLGTDEDTAGIQLAIKRDRGEDRHSQRGFAELFAGPEEPRAPGGPSLATVHSAKGKTFEAVFLVLKGRDANNRIYGKVLNNRIQQDEELRIVYVAITRPRKLLALAVPEATADAWRRKFLG